MHAQRKNHANKLRKAMTPLSAKEESLPPASHVATVMAYYLRTCSPNRGDISIGETKLIVAHVASFILGSKPGNHCKAKRI